MDYVRQSGTWYLFNKLSCYIGESVCASLLGRFHRAVLKKYEASVLVKILRRDGFISRAFETSVILKILTVVFNAPAFLISWIYRLLPGLWDGSIFARALRGAGSHPYVLISWLMFALMILPQKRWSNAYPLVILAVSLLLYWISSLRETPRTLDLKRIGAWVFLYFVLVLLFSFVSTSIRMSISSLPRYSSALLAVLICVCTIKSIHEVKRVLDFTLFGVAVCAAYAFLQRRSDLEVNPSFVDISVNAHIPGRVFAFFDNPNAFAFVLVMFLPFAMAYAVGAKGALRRLYGAVVLIMGTAALAMTYSRGAWLAFVCEIFVFTLLVRPMFLPVLFLACIAAVPFLPATIHERIMTIFNNYDTSITSRGPVYEAAVRLVSKRHVAGVGLSLETAREYMRRSEIYLSDVPYVHAHNIFLQIAIEIGLLGLLAFLGALFSGIKLSIMGMFNKSKELRAILAAGITGVVGMLLCGIADYPLSYPRLMLTFWLLFAILLATVRATETE